MIFLKVEGKKIPFTSNMRTSKAVWNILSDFSKKVGIVGWWVTWPAEKVDGYIVSSYIALGQNVIKGNLRKDVPYQTYPENFFEEIEKFISESQSNYQNNFKKIFKDVEINKLKEDVKVNINAVKWVLNTDDIFKNIGLYILKK